MALQPRLFLLLTAVLGMLTLVPTAAVLAVPPTLNLNVPGSRFVGQNFNFDLTFDNSGATGYGPYVDVFLPQPGIDGPASGPNDGISFVNVTYAGNAVNTTTLTCANPPGNTVHPLTGLTVNCPATPANYTGPLPYVWQMLVVELPFPSFTAGQAPVQLDFTANISDFADVGQSLPIYATPGFRYGTDPLGLSPPSIGATDVDTLTPNLFNIDKDYDARGNPNLPGPNFRHRYTLRVDLAQAQRFSPLTITDILPPNIVYLGIISTSPGGATVLTQPPIGVASTAPNNVLSVTWGNINGAGAGTDASVTFEFYVPNADASGNAVINPNTCADTFANNTMNVAAVWQVRDPRDGAPVSVSANDTHSLRNECLTFDKSANNLTDSRNSPGDIIEYTLRFTVSDYFSLGNLVINDVLGDGLRFFGTPTLSFRDAGNNFAAAAMNPANYIVDTSRFPPAFGGTGACGDGSTRLTFNVSNEMIARGGDGVATGGRVGGSFQPTFGEIRFRARIQDLFACTPGDISVDNNDTLTNSATITSVIHDNVTQLPLPSNPTVTETDSANINVAGGSLTKTVYARNGVVGPVPQVSPAETLTYRLRYTFPNGADFENFRIQDFLPLPIFLASEVTTFNPTICGVPAAGVACYGPANTFTAVIPTITSNVPDNWIQFNFGTYDDPINAPVEVDIVFTVTATSSPIADGMIFTNVATARRGTTSGSTITQTSIVQTRYTQPVLTIRKGIVATNAILPSFIGTPVLPGGVTISAPGSTCPRVTGTVNHANYTAGGFNSNLANADVGDLVTFVIIIENTGRSPNGAFDVRVRDDLPAGLAIPTGGAGLNLCVRSGAGANLPFTNIGTGLFDPAGGIELTDPSPILGALRSDRNPSTGAYGNSGNNIAVITFDLQVVNPAALGQTITNTGTLFNYAGNEGGTDFTTVDPTDPASIIVGGPRPTKQLISTSESHTLDSPAPAAVAVGEIARFRLYIRLSEGTFGGASGIQLRDNLPTGFTFLDDGSARFAFLSSGAGITSTTLTCPNVTPYTQTDAALANIPSSSITCAFPDAAVSRSAAVDDDNYASGDDVFFSLGSLTNADNDPAQPEFIVVEFNALVNNSATNNAGVSLDNTFRLRLNGVDVGADSNSVQVRVNEPSLTISKDFTTIPVDAGDTAVFTITVTANGGADTTAAFDVTLTDVLNANFNPVSVTAATTSGACGGTAANTSASFSGQTMNGAVTCMNPNTTATFVITATLRDNVGVCTTLSNTVAMVYTSLPGANGSSPNSSGSVTPGSAGSINGERNGSGGINDYTGTSSVSTSICSAPTFDKLAVSPALYTLGDSIIYNILVTLPEGTSNGMSLLDDLPAGLNYVPGSAQIITTAAASGGILSADFAGTVPAPTVTAPGGSGADVTLAFGAIVTTGDNNAANNSFVVQLRALVMGSVSTNVDGAALTNNASLTYDNNGTPATLTDPTPPTITVIEPQITTTKSVTPSTNVQAGDDLTYTVRFTNTGRATAYDVTADDVLAPGTDFILSSPAAITCTTNFGAGTIAGTITDNGATLRFDGSPAGGWDIPATNPDSYIECSYAVRVLSSVLVNSSSVNTIDADWSSQDGTSSGDERVYTDVNSSPVDGTQDTATATFTVPTPTFDKSDGGAGALPVVPIGAAVTYTLTITSPLGTIRNLSIVDNLPAGLVYNSDAVFSGITGAAALVSAPNDGTAPVSVTWNLGNAVVSSSPATITFTASVANVPANVGGLVLTNSASMQYSSGAGVPQPLITDSDPFTIAGEPLITTTKSVNPTTGVRAGDMVTYTVRFTNTGAGTAFDVTALDLIPAGTDYTGPAAIVCTTNFGTGTLDGTITDNGTSLTFDGSPAGGWDIPAGGYIECTYSLTATGALPLDGTHTNTIDADWSTLNGNVPGERVYTDPGDGTTVDEASASFTSPAPAFGKSDGGAGNLPDVAIGDTVTYTLTISSPPGTLRDLVVSDTLPAGVTYGGSYLVSAGIAPAPTFAQAGSVLIWTFGDAVISSSPVTITYSVTVNNSPANVGGAALTNAASLSYDTDTSTVTLLGSDTFTIAESQITTTKSVSPATAQADDDLTYTVRFSNSGALTAYDVTADDALPTGTDYTGPAAIVCTTNFGTGTLDGTITDNGTSLTFDGSPAGGWDIPAGGYIECVYIVRVTSAVFANGSYTNTIDADWTSVNGSVPGERVYDDTPGVAVDGTQDTATATFSVPAPTFTKSDNGAALVNIGSTITYTLTVNSPLGTIRDLTITDVLPAGLIYNNDAVLNGMSAATTTVSAPNDGTANVTVTWAFGNALISGSPATITFTATVADVPANIPALVLTNNAALDYSDAAGIPQPQITGSDSVTIAGAPIITTTKAANPTTGVQAGDVVTYTVRFTNTGDSTAFDVTADDLLPTGVDYVGPAAIVCTTNFGTGTLDGTITDNGAALSFDGSPAGGWDIPATDPTDSYIECVYSVTATSSLFISGTFTNTIDADWSSQNGNVPNERLYTDPGDGTTVDTASASFTSPAPTFSKSDNGTTQAPIGGTITYTLTVNSSLGTLRGFSVSDVLPAGLIYNNDAVIVGVSSVAPTVSAPNDGTANVTITWNFGDAVITARPLTITFTATVANVPANVGGLLLTNTAALDYSDAAGTPQPQITGSDSFTIAGSEITTTKNVNPTTSVQAGDAVTYTVRFTNTGGSTAYEVTADDLLPPGTDYTGAAAIVCTTNFGVGTLDGTITDSGAALSFDGSPAGSWDIPAGGYIECVYSVVATSALALDGTHTNTIDADWTSLNGVIPGERTYTDPSDGTIMDTASASFSSAAPTFSKSDGGAGALPNVTIGGMLTYTLTISSPLGTLRNLAISDTLPAGLAYGGSFNVSAGIAPAPTFTQVGNMLTWTFGDAVISSASVTITYTAVVENVAGSQNGVTRSNSATLSYNNNAGTQTRTASDALTVVEPVLTIGKSILVPPAPPSAGGVVTYQVTLAHAANSVGTAFDLVLTDTLPAGLVNLSAVNITATGIAPPSFEVAGATLRLPSSADGTFDLPAGATVTITFQATIDSSAVPGAVLNNTADVIWSSLDGSAANERSDGVGTPDGADLLNSGALNDYEVNASASFTVGSYGIQKALDSTSLADTAGATVAIGEIVTYALTLTLPEGTIPSLTLVDQLPAGMAFVSGSVTVDSSGFGGSIPNAPIIASLGSSGDDVTLTFTNISVTADGNAANNSFVVRLQARVLNETGSSSGVVLGNSATLQPGSGPISASGTVNVTVGEPNLTIVKTFVPNVGGAGDVIQIQLLVNNIGTAPAYDLNIQDTLDARFSSITAVTTPGGFTFNLAGNTVTYTGGPVLVNTPLTFTFSVVLTNAVNANDVIPNTAVVNMYSSLPGTDANERTYPAVSDGDQLTVIGPDLSITKDDGGVSYTPGLPLIYTIVVSNTRGSNIAHAVVFDDLTSGGRYTSISWNCTAVAPTGGGVCHAPTSGTGDISTTVDLPLGASVTFVVNVTVNPAATGSLINTARVDTPAGVTDPDPLDNSAADTNSNNPIVNLSITKDDGTAAYTPGTSVTYTMIVRNSGPSDAINATVIDNLPPALLNAAWTCVASGAATCTPSGTGSINDTVTIAAGAANFLTYTLTANVDPAATGNLDNTVTVNVPPNFTDSAPQDNRATDSNSNDPRVDLRVTKDDGIIIYTPGTAQTYTIVVSNAGPSSVIGATVVDDLTTGGRYSSIAWDCTTVAATGGAACGASGTADINLAVDLPAGSTITFTVNVTVDSAFTGNLPNTVTITAPGGVTETDTNNNTATDTDGQIAADLAITKSNNTNIFRPGDTLVYTIIVSNNGPANVVGGLVTDTIPTLLDNPIWTCTASGAALCAANGTGDINDTVSLDVGETLTYTVTATVNQNAPVGQVSNTATIAPPVIMLDPDMTNNSATDTDNFGLFEPPQGFKTFDANRLPELTWSMYWVNNGNDPNTTLPIQIIDPIPQGTTYIDNSLVCAPEGQSTVTSCVFDQPNNRIVVTGTLYADPGVFNEQDAQHEILISYRTTVNGGVRQVDNIAALNWDANASGDVSDELAIPQMPVEARARWGDAALGAGAPVGLVKNVFPPFASPGDTVAWTILLTNPSSAPMANVVISDVLPDGLEPLSVTATAGTATLNGQTVNFTLGVLGANETVTLTVQTRISADYDGDPFLINRAVMNNGLSAEARLIVVDTLPATGETPSWRAWLLAGLWALSLMLGWRLARRL